MSNITKVHFDLNTLVRRGISAREALTMFLISAGIDTCSALSGRANCSQPMMSQLLKKLRKDEFLNEPKRVEGFKHYTLTRKARTMINNATV